MNIPVVIAVCTELAYRAHRKTCSVSSIQLHCLLPSVPEQLSRGPHQYPTDKHQRSSVQQAGLDVESVSDEITRRKCCPTAPPCTASRHFVVSIVARPFHITCTSQSRSTTLQIYDHGFDRLLRDSLPGEPIAGHPSSRVSRNGPPSTEANGWPFAMCKANGTAEMRRSSRSTA